LYCTPPFTWSRCSRCWRRLGRTRQIP
jgi:hypothetical protein